jgi:hypothetical protein
MTEPQREYVSPFQAPGHDGPCHDMKIGEHEVTEPAGAGVEIPIRIVAYEGEGLNLAAGAIEVPAGSYGEGGVPVAQVKRLLATLLRELAGELDEQADAAQLDEGDKAEGES